MVLRPENLMQCQGYNIQTIKNGKWEFRSGKFSARTGRVCGVNYWFPLWTALATFCKIFQRCESVYFSNLLFKQWNRSSNWNKVKKKIHNTFHVIKCFCFISFTLEVQYSKKNIMTAILQHLWAVLCWKYRLHVSC